MNFGPLIIQHQEYVMRIIYRFIKNREAAEDIVQDAIVKVLKSAGPNDLDLFRAWFVMIALNTARNELRRPFNKRREYVDIGLCVDPRASHETTAGLKQELEKLTEQLPYRQRVAFTLKLEGLDFLDIAEIMNCPYDTAKANFRHGLVKIRELVGINSL